MLLRHGRKALLFLAIGGGVFVVGQMLLVLFIEIGGWPEILANAVQLILTFVLNFLLNSITTWRDRERSVGSFIRFVISRGGMVLISFSIYVLLVQFCDCSYLLANAVGATVGMVANYVVGEQWVFRKLEEG